MSPNQTYHIEESNLERQRLLAQFLGPFTTSVLEKIDFPPNARCLDLGCGIGETTRLIASFLKQGGSCLGVDQNPELIQAASQAANGLPVSFQQGDAMRLPFEDGAFDFVFTRYLLTHLPQPETNIREMLRVARPGGTVMAIEPDASSQASYPHSWAYERLPGLVTPLGLDVIIGRKLVALFRAAGAKHFRVEAFTAIEHGDDTVRRLWRMTVQSMAAGIQGRNAMSAAEFDELIAEFQRVEQDPDAVLMSLTSVCLWATA
jgi:SAM-dependent methyltransferase